MDMKPVLHPPKENSDTSSSFDTCLEQVTRFLDEGVFILNAEGCMTFLNAAGERILGWTSKALLGSVAHFKIHYPNPVEEATSLEACPIHRCIKDGQVYHIDEDIFVHRDGRLLPVSFVSSPLWENEQIVGSVTIFKEIGSRREVEREIKQAQDIALETSRLKSEFLANMSHEIRTPIHGVIGMAGLLLDSKLNKEQRELATTTRDSAQALLTVANDILDFSRIEAGKLSIRSEDFRPLKVVEDVSELLAPQAQRKNISILVDVSHKVPSVVQGDPARIRQVLLNLVGNAVKFTKKGEVVIRIRLEKKNKTQVVLRFAIADTGIGIPKSAQHRLFQPFTQVDGSSTRPYGGTGLGLSIANRLVELMGGQIGYGNRKEKGSIFWFAIPLARSSNASETDPPSKLTSAGLQGVKILIVDPQQTSQTVLLNQLLRWNMKGTSVESPEEILAYLKHEASTGAPCNLVLVSSPPDGKDQMEQDLSVARTIAKDPNLLPVRLVLLTGNNDKKYLEEARHAGYVAVISKPLQNDRLLECLISLLSPKPEVCPPPDARVSHTQFSQETIGSPAVSKPKHEYRVLLAEDNAVIQKVAQIQLHSLGYAVHTVANGKEAVAFIQTGFCSLVLMDCHMPVMDGYQATQSIRRLSSTQTSSTQTRVPIIGMLAKTVGRELKRCLEAGMDDVLIKPVQMESLKDILNRWLPQKKGTL